MSAKRVRSIVRLAVNAHRAGLLRYTGTPYLLVAAALALASLTGLHKHGYIAGGDIWPAAFVPGNHVLHDAGNLWSYFGTGLGSPYFAELLIGMGVWGQVLLWMGLPGPTVQYLFLAAMLVFQGLGTTYFSLAIYPKQRCGAIVAGIGVATCLFSAISFLNPIQSFALGFFPLAAGYMIKRFASPGAFTRMGAEIGLGGLGLYVLSGTPPLAVYFCIWVCAWFVACWLRYPQSRRAIVLPALCGAVVAVGVNAWWAYAAYITLFKNSALSQSFASPTGWSWVNQNAGILQQLSMRSIWSWPRPEYFPWAAGYAHLPGALYLYVPAIFALVGVIASRKNRWTRILVAVTAVSLFIGKGTHPPFGSVNGFLYMHVPLFWLFRDPQVETASTLYPILFVLSGFGIASTFAYVPPFLRRFNLKQSANNTIFALATVALFTAYFANSVPFVSGAFIPNKWLNGKASNVVTIPKYWFAAAKYINKDSATGRILLLPNDDYYQMLYTWGYYGADQVAQTLLRRPIITVSPDAGGYFSGGGALPALERTLEANMISRRNVQLWPILRALDIDWIVVRSDTVSSLQGRSIMSPADANSYLRQQRGIHFARAFDAVAIYRVDSPGAYVSAYRAAGLWRGTGPPKVLRADDALNGDVPWIDVPGTSIPVVALADSWDLLNGPTPHADKLPASGTVQFSLDTYVVSVRPINSRTLSISLSGRPAHIGPSILKPQYEFTMPFVQPKGTDITLQIGAQYFRITEGLRIGHNVTVGIYARHPRESRAEISLWLLQPARKIVPRSFSRLGDCNFHQDKLAQRHLSLTHERDTIRLSSDADAACVSTTGLPVIGRYLIALDYRSFTGGPADVAFTQGSIVRHYTLSTTHQWHTWRKWVSPRAHHRSALVLYAFASAHAPRTTIEYRDVRLRAMKLLGTRHVALSRIEMKVPAGKLTVSAARLTPIALHSNEWQTFNANSYKPMTDSQAGLRFSTASDIVDLRARQEALGAAQWIPNASDQWIRVEFDARSIRGSGALARIVDQQGNALWQSDIPQSSDWQHTSAVVHVPASSSVALVFYSYAMPGGTETQYRHVRLFYVGEGAGALTWVAGAPPARLPTRWRQISNGAFEATLPPESRLLTLAVAYDPGWEVRINGKVVHWQHVLVDGLLNGWLVPRDTRARSIVIEYAPGRLFSRLSLLAKLLVVACLVTLTIAETLKKYARRNESR